VVIREGAADALRACLELISQRESQQRPQWYQNIYDEAQKGNFNFNFLKFKIIIIFPLLLFPN
jgi:hypothetical protein